MEPLSFEIDVPESREVTLTLPPDVPAGRVRVTVVVQAPLPPTPLRRLRAILPDVEPGAVYSGQLIVCDPELPG